MCLKKEIATKLEVAIAMVGWMLEPLEWTARLVNIAAVDANSCLIDDNDI